MVGSIDPRCEQIRGTHWPDKVVWLIGTRVAEAILASGLQPHQRPDIWMQAIRSHLKKLLCHGGRPHMGPGSCFACPGRRGERGVTPRSRGTKCPSCWKNAALEIKRAQGRPGAHRTHGPRAEKNARGRTTGTGGSSGGLKRS